MASIKRFEDLEVWQKSRELCGEIGHILLKEGLSRNFKLRDQIDGSSGSIMDNIAEGFDRGGNKEFIQFLAYAKGSASELKSQLYRILDRKFIDKDEFEKLYEKTHEISRMLGGFMNYLKATDFKGNKLKEPQSWYGNPGFETNEFHSDN
ncbi:MAG TPA: four helix bundle protein [Flavobacteriales bacterium]|nr:four helix bundle protein [Flavobacteriales bacterium]